MRVVILILIITLKVTENFAIEKREQHNGEQKLLLRKLLSLQQNNSTEKALMWNEIFANVLVNKIKILFNKQPESGLEDNPDVVTKFVSKIIALYGKLFYKVNNIAHNNGKNEEEIKVDEIMDPKKEVEKVEPKYHGRLENATEYFDIDKRTVCPEHSVSDEKGNCIDPENSRFIMAIPHQCPIGYRRDRLGYCRAIF
ncbi:uncharacterized protein LOC133516282 [Cydia pomonella]|uniref:uncharacterized protein LOC133516282 n=1 Tax=Cydia pomonella TaxID=82600 RepID=UPI002ADD3CC8|nr:uncharacterized protein LOC133516282 [Cydia pomonella]